MSANEQKNTRLESDANQGISDAMKARSTVRPGDPYEKTLAEQQQKERDIISRPFSSTAADQAKQ